MRKFLIVALLFLPVNAIAQDVNGSVRVQRNIATVYRINTDQPFHTVNIGNSKIADVVPLTDRSIIIQGHMTGTTNLIFLNRENVPIKEIVVSVDEQGSGFVRIHNKKLLNSFTAFTCWDGGCQFVGENTVSEPAPLPRGHQNVQQNINQGGNGLQPTAPLSVPSGD